MSSNESPGNDGLTKEFYVCFFKDVAQYLINALNLSFDYGMLSTSQRQAVITYLRKRGQIKDILKIGDRFHSLMLTPSLIKVLGSKNQKGAL